MMNEHDTPDFVKLTVKQLEGYERMASFEKIATLGLLTMGIAHEINNAVNYVFTGIVPLKKNIECLLEVLKKYEGITENCNLEEKLREIDAWKKEIDMEYTIEEIHIMLHALAEGAKRTAEIIKDLQGYSGVTQSEKEMIDINSCIDSSLNLLRNKYKNRIEIIKSYGEVPMISVYRRKISQVFMNILINAIRAIQDRGKIYISTKREDRQVLISIKDTGTGMSDETKSRMFEPFFTTDPIDGTGLGMPISLNIIEEHKGDLKVHSKLGEGTEIVIRLPLE